MSAQMPARTGQHTSSWRDRSTAPTLASGRPVAVSSPTRKLALVALAENGIHAFLAAEISP